ncbi:hypothetical protein LLG96_05045 [bacterium]|nr:hypothetical protein [bacterium]
MNGAISGVRDASVSADMRGLTQQTNGKETAESSLVENILNKQSATVRRSVFTLKQNPEPLPPALGTTEVLPLYYKMSDRSAIIQQRAFTREQIPEPLPPAVGSTDIFAFKSLISQQPAMEQRSQFLLEQTPPPMPSKIGEEDLPGGFKKENILNGQPRPLYGLVRGIVEIEDVIVLFDIRA